MATKSAKEGKYGICVADMIDDKGMRLGDAPQYSLTDYISKIAWLKEEAQRGMLMIGQLLLEIANSGAYKEQCETFSEFLAMPEISFSRSSAFKMMAIAEWMGKMKVGYEFIKGIDLDKIYKINRVTTPENVHEYIEMAKELSRSDLTAEIRKLKGMPELAEEATAPELVRAFLYDYLPKKKVQPAELEIKDLLGRYEKWRRQQG